jgi:hypothetical protein
MKAIAYQQYGTPDVLHLENLPKCDTAEQSHTDEETVAVFDGSLTALPFLRDHARLRPERLPIAAQSAGDLQRSWTSSKFCARSGFAGIRANTVVGWTSRSN